MGTGECNIEKTGIMTEVKPFKGILYNKNKTNGGYVDVVAPPYDVISERMRDGLYEKSAHNVIRLILGKSSPQDNETYNKYTRAGKFFDEWQKDNVLVRDDKESFYIYLQEYPHDGKKCRRVGFLGLMKIGETGKDTVLPHEYTHAKPKEDRLNLIKQVNANLSPIFTLYDDQGGDISGMLERVMRTDDPLIDIDVDGERHKLWRLSGGGSIKKIREAMKDKMIFIADGHHRYEVARTYRDIRRKKKDYDGSADHVMMYFTDLTDRDNLTVMATHRVIKRMPSADEGVIVSKLKEYFDIREYDDLAGLKKCLKENSDGDHNFGFFAGSKFLFLRPKDKKRLIGLITDKKSLDWKKLDVSVLHSAVLTGILSVDNAEGNITYVRDPEEGEILVRDGSHMAAFFLNPTRVEQLKAVAELGEMMPQKSTYFYPKLLTGLVINRFGE